MSLKPTEFIITNLRGLKKFTINFPERGVVFVRGKNEKGKTTAINSVGALFSANNTTPLADGQTNAWTNCEFVLPTGETVMVKQDLSETKSGSRFVLVDENGTVKKGVNDVKSFLGYNPITIEDFIAYGLYADGKRRQRDIFLNLLGAEVKQRVFEIEEQEAETYKLRTTANTEVMMLGNVVEKSKPSDYDIELSKSIDSINEKYQEAEKLHLQAHSLLESTKATQTTYEEKSRLLEAKNKEIQNKATQYRDTEKRYDDDIARLEKLLADAKENKLKDLKVIKDEGEKLRGEYANMKEELERMATVDLTHLIKEESAARNNMLDIKRKHDEAKAALIHVTNYNNNVESHLNAKKKWEELDRKVAELRDEKQGLVVKSDCPIKNIRITEDGLEINIDDRWLPYDEQHVAMSQLIINTAKIILLVNKNLPVVLISRGESIDSERVKWLVDLAGEYDGIFLCERVDDNYDEIVCEVIEA